MLNGLEMLIGSGVSDVARDGVPGFVANRFPPTFPWRTLAANVMQSFVVGLTFNLTIGL